MKKILFISSNYHTPWGGSELLWYKTAVYFKSARKDVDVGVGAREWPEMPHHIKEIINTGGQLFSYPVPPRTPVEYLKIKMHGSIDRKRRKLINRFSPDLILHSMGKSFEGGNLMRLAYELAVPYVNLIHLSSELQWPTNSEIELYRKGYAKARCNYFVANANRELVRKQLGLEIPNSAIVRNPISVSGSLLPYPDTSQGYNLALPALLVPIHKGQDVLFEVLAQTKWKKRPIYLNLYGKGEYSKSLQAYCRYLDLQNVHFKGYSKNIEDVWAQNHALIMGSRMEGLPLTLIEAMSCGRPAIVPDVAGMKECVVDGKTAFIARTAHPSSVDEALEKAWRQRDRWPEMGRCGAARVTEIIPSEPVKEFAQAVLDLINDGSSGG